MPMPRRSSLFSAAALIGLIACGSETQEPSGAAVLDGTWRGGASGEGFMISAVLQLAEQDTVIGGEGYVSGSGLECAVAITGARSGERIRFDLTCPGYLPIRFRGDRTGASRIFGLIGGSGLPSLDMELLKQ